MSAGDVTDIRDYDGWDEDPPPERERLLVDLEGYAGPLDVLLELARTQKVDLAKISILHLAEQYLGFIAELRRLKLEIAADYLVMAAWLAYLKSRLLLPSQAGDEEEPSGAEMAAALAFRLRRLEAMRQAGENILAMPRLGRDVFTRGKPEKIATASHTVLDVSLYELLKAYAVQRQRRAGADTLSIAASELYSVDDALHRLGEMLGHMPDWHVLSSFLPTDLRPGLNSRSAVASVFAASLELTKAGEAQMRQEKTFGPIYVRKRIRTARDNGGGQATGRTGA